MNRRLPPLLMQLSLVVTGVLVGHLLKWISIGVLWATFGDNIWPSWLTFPLGFLDIIGGLIGLLVGVYVGYQAGLRSATSSPSPAQTVDRPPADVPAKK